MKCFLIFLVVQLSCHYACSQWSQNLAIQAQDRPQPWDNGAGNYDTFIQEGPSYETNNVGGHGFADVAAVCQDHGVIILRRQDGSVNFYRPWSEYREGFGNPRGEFWIGLTSLHRLTSQRRYRLRVDIVDWSGETKWAEYERFSVASEGESFKLSISGYNKLSTAGNSMISDHSMNGMKFSTYDRDHDKYSKNCAVEKEGAWWYRGCTFSNPMGPYKPAGYVGWKGIHWYHAYKDYRSLKAITLRLVPV